MTFSDEILMAYADGEVDEALRVQIEAAMAVEPGIAAVVERHRKLRAQLSGALSGALSEPIPERFLAALAAPSPVDNNVIPLADRRAPRWRLREWSALAAMFVLGISVGFAVMSRNDAIVSSEGGTLMAARPLAAALTEQLASTQRGDEPVAVGISFNARSGDLCRTFAIRSSRLAGIACRDKAGWRVQMLTDSEVKGESTAYRQAASAMPAAVLSQVEQQIVGEPFDAPSEAKARREDWRH